MTRTSLAAKPFDRCKILALGSAIGLLAGCGSILAPSQEPLQIYVLRPRFEELANVPPVHWQLAVGRPETAETLQSARIVLQRGETLDYYANAQWSDAAPRLLQSLLVEGFESSGVIAGVAPESAGVRADYILETELRDFEAQYQSENGAPGVAVRIVARLLSHRGDVIGTFETAKTARAAQNNVPDVVAAFDKATGEALEDIVGWALKSPPPNAVSSGRVGKGP